LSDPVADFTRKSGPLHLLLDVPTPDLAKIKAAGAKDVRTLATRRVYFLAANHRDSVLADESLRRALAHAINRDQALTRCFGAPHHSLNGPYPAGSWACCPDGRVPKDLFDSARAETFLQKVKGKRLELELKYPDDDPRVKCVCEAIAEQWAELAERAGRPITVRLTPLPLHQLQSDLLARRYQLAYWHYDFPDDSYPLWPLFDPRDQAIATGSNYLGFKDDGTLAELLQKANSYRDFNEVKRLTHDIHALLIERMPLIPLWQLDYHISVHPSLKLPAFDPLRVFANIEEWEFSRKETP
jgi:ABC-type oligopeptide transport system substrate-binding subunit